jgi:hypothetical protein
LRGNDDGVRGSATRTTCIQLVAHAGPTVLDRRAFCGAAEDPWDVAVVHAIAPCVENPPGRRLTPSHLTVETRRMARLFRAPDREMTSPR